MAQIPTSTSTEFALDTNVAIDFLNHPANSLAKVGPSARLAISMTAVGELFFGAENSTKVPENLAKVEDLIRHCRVLPCDVETARWFGRVHRSLRMKGKPIPEDDMWIAAAAIQHGLPILTHDAHFHEVDGLDVVDW